LLDGVMVRRATHTPSGTARAGSGRSCWSSDLATTSPRTYRSGAADYTLAACILQVIGTFFMLYRGRYRTASFEESVGLWSSVVNQILLGATQITAVFPPGAVRPVAGHQKAPWNMASWISATVALILIAVGRPDASTRLAGPGCQPDADQPRPRRISAPMDLRILSDSLEVAFSATVPPMSAIASEDISSA
jgi:hypothetical protein